MSRSHWLSVACVALIAALAGPAPASAQSGLFGEVVAVRARAVAHRSQVSPGDRLVVAIEMHHEEGFHTWPSAPVVPPEFGADFPAIATTIDVVSVPPDTVVHPIQWPAPVPVTVYYTGAPVPLESYAGTMAAYVPLTLPTSVQPGRIAIELLLGYQSCDETTCYRPQQVPLRAEVTVAEPGTAVSAAANEPDLFAAFDVAAFTGNAASAGAQSLEMSAFGRSFTFDPSGISGLAVLLLLAALGGMLLNFTPCVLPVIPLKVMSLSRAAGHPGRLLFLGAMMSLGVVAFWLALGGAIAFVSGFDAISTLFQTGWFSAVVGVIVAAMAVGMLGLYDVTLPQSVYRVRPDQESPQGSFLFGILTAVLSTPCTAPFMGAAAAWAATQAPPVTIATFACIGAGMAVPYLLLSIRPGLLSRMPRSGPASVLLKQAMGLLMLAVAAFFIGLSVSSALQRPPDPPSAAYWWVVALFVLVACAWVALRTWRITGSVRTRSVVLAAAGTVGLVAVLLARQFTSEGPIDWTYYTPQRFAKAAAAGEVMVVDFTAEWCLNCRALESGVLHTDDVVAALAQEGVVPMRVDLTGDNPDGQAKLAELEWVGIPLLAVFGPGLGYDRPLMYDTYTPQVVIDAVRRARSGDS